MSFWRIVLAWLIMAAVPLQGIAASSMVFCAMGSQHERAHAGGDAAPHQASTATATASGHDHAGHVRADAKVTKTAAGTLPDAGHACGVCGACCHATAIAELPHWVAPQPPEQTREAELFLLIDSPPSQVPDKPPRA